MNRTIPLFPAVWLSLLLLTLALGGCATRQLPPAPEATNSFKAFKSVYFSPPQAPGLLVNASLSWRQGKKTARVILDFWGDFQQGDRSGRLRMDTWSNVGGNLSYLMEDEQGLAAFYPDPPKVYSHTDPVTGAQLLGLPFPFSMTHLAQLFVGNFAPLVPPTFAAATRDADGGHRFTFARGPVTALVLDAASKPIALEGQVDPLPGTSPEQAKKTSGPWRIAFSRYEEATDGLPSLATTLDLSLPADATGILRIKTRQLTVAPWPDTAMTLTIPEEA
ncbi:MAG: hypothetical protein KKB70_11490, partial [Proteobacteria bacterium]|nr:hypothetical protein [Pseudomonadota bacterium]MBU1610865.1 hypothetical protein [Pseudomonadota bacterium]